MMETAAKSPTADQGRRTVKTLAGGDVAPPFASVTLDGRPMQLPVAGTWTLISFLRYASCPMCNLRVRELALGSGDLESHRVTWVAVFHSPSRRLLRHMRKDALAHVVADPHRELYALYGVGRSWWGLLVSMLIPTFYWRFLRASLLGFWGGAIDDSFHSMPADFLVAPDGRIHLAHHGRHIGDHVKVAVVIGAVNGPDGKS